MDQLKKSLYNALLQLNNSIINEQEVDKTNCLNPGFVKLEMFTRSWFFNQVCRHFIVCNLHITLYARASSHTLFRPRRPLRGLRDIRLYGVTWLAEEGR